MLQPIIDTAPLEIAKIYYTAILNSIDKFSNIHARQIIREDIGQCIKNINRKIGINEFIVPVQQLSFKYQKLEDWLRQYNRVWFLERGYANYGGIQEENFLDFTVESLEYLANDSIEIKNERILACLAVDLIPKLEKGDRLKRVQVKIQ